MACCSAPAAASGPLPEAHLGPGSAAGAARGRGAARPHACSPWAPSSGAVGRAGQLHGLTQRARPRPFLLDPYQNWERFQAHPPQRPSYKVGALLQVGVHLVRCSSDRDVRVSRYCPSARASESHGAGAGVGWLEPVTGFS